MTAEKPQGQPTANKQRGGDRTTPQPQWADGLRQMYDSVVDEELPDMFRDLLAKLDSKD